MAPANVSFYNSILMCLFFVVCICDSSFDATTVTDTLQEALDCHGKPALAVGVVKNGQVIYSNGFGVTDLITRKPVTDETLFSVASVTKSFTAALFVKLLHQQTNLTLNSKVREFLGDDFVMPDNLRTQETTFMDLLSHRTGMLYNNFLRLDNTFNRDNLLSRLRFLPTDHGFRTDYFQNKLLYGLLAKISEMLGGDNDKKWEDFITEHLFKPLGMRKSTFNTRLNFSREDRAKGYQEMDGPGIQELVSDDTNRLWGGMWGSSSIVSSVKDMAKWMNFHLSGGKNHRMEQILDEKLMNELHIGRLNVKAYDYVGIGKPQFPVTSVETAYALGLRVGYYRGYRLLAHTGGLPGYKAYMAMLPDENIGVIALLTGSETSFRRRVPIVHYLLDTALGFEPYLNKSTICSYPFPWITKDLEPSYRPNKTDIRLQFPVDQYEDSFSNKASTDIKIEFNQSLTTLQMTFGWGRWQLLLLPQTNNNNNNNNNNSINNNNNFENLQSFYMKGIEPSFPPDFNPISFLPHPDRKDVVIGIEATAFESKLPPIYCKTQYLDICDSIARKRIPFDSYDYNPNNSASIHSSLGELFFTLFLITMYMVFNN